MNETTMTIVGNVLNEPDCRRLEESKALVINFKVVATARRYDRHEERWVDGDTLRLRVTCWRQLAENVVRSVHVGDPVIVTGRLSSRTWETEDHVKRVAYELEASSVGHDLTRGRAKFARVKASTATSSIDDELSDARIAGQLSTPVAAVNALPRQRDYDADLGGFVTTVQEPVGADQDPFAEDVLTELDNAINAAFDGSALAAMGGFTAPDNAAELTTASAAAEILAGSPAGQVHAGTTAAQVVAGTTAAQVLAGSATDEVSTASDAEDSDGDRSAAAADGETTTDESEESIGGRRRRNRGKVPVPA